jgi:conjugal transfer pilus assembly protein TraE
MLSDIAQRRAQSLLRQRNLLAIASAVLATVATVAISAAVTRDREVVLVPTVRTPLTITSRSVPKDYLELVTRDTALMLLNRSPEGLDYWMETILGLAHPSAHGALKAELIRIVTEQRGSDVAQAFVIRAMSVDTAGLSSDVTGTLKTYVGAQVIASEDRRFRFTWAYAGLRLSLTGFKQLPLKNKAEEAR